jgi:glycogen debranching enzyme
MGEVIQIEDQYYILASSSAEEGKTRVLKHGDTFLITDKRGDIRPLGFESHGLFHEGTRFLSHFMLLIDGKHPILLNSAITKWNDFLAVDLTNADFHLSGGELVRRGTIHLCRSVFIWDGCLYETLRVTNYGLYTMEFALSFDFTADFVDIFEVRGLGRIRHGQNLEPEGVSPRIVLGYRGLDDVVRKTELSFQPTPTRLTKDHAEYLVRLDPYQDLTFGVNISCDVGEKGSRCRAQVSEAFDEMKQLTRAAQEWMSFVETSNQEFDNWVTTSRLDVLLMLSRTPYGWYPYAGIPWYSTVFGRDALIVGLQTLWFCPEISRGVLGFLAAHQASATIREEDAEPGKILHELRKGEMANLHEVPFGSYYGTVDATPLFVTLACLYFQRTGDRVFIEGLWPHVERALAWMDSDGDPDGDGFVEYEQKSATGLSNQGWKDSVDSVFHSDGSLATAPIALCEVQGYVYEAKARASWAARRLGMVKRSRELSRQAESLRRHFDAAFWSSELRSYVLALDQDKHQCRVRTSNAGHALFSGIASGRHVEEQVSTLMGEASFNGWGVRTVASDQARYNPMSYHNGSVWPHDNALIGFGMTRYGFKREAVRILSGLFDASSCIEFSRLPELFCGFPRREGEGPTGYPVACSPQAWASGSVFLLLQGLLGITVNGLDKTVYFDYPFLPPYLREVVVRNLLVGEACIDVAVRRQEEDVAVVLLRRKGDVEIVVRKPALADYFS